MSSMFYSPILDTAAPVPLPTLTPPPPFSLFSTTWSLAPMFPVCLCTASDNSLSGTSRQCSPRFSGPQYLSSCSSDVILSDIRPIQLEVKALRSINTFLNEFLWNILTISRSLVTDRMKAGVLKILPTSLGKAALLEAGVELKAY